MTLTPPNRIVIDFLEGINSRADAIAYARGFITSHFEVPEQSGYYVMPYKAGFAYEVHEGGSRKAFLPGILRTIADDPGATVSVRSGSRVLQVSKGQRDSFNSVLLPEELSSYLENVIEPDSKAPNLIPFQMDNIVWLFAGTAIGALGGLVFILSLAFYALDPSQATPPRLNVTATENLPLSQWQKMTAQVNGDTYIAAMRYENGQWHFDTKDNPKKAEAPAPDANPTDSLSPESAAAMLPPNATAPGATPSVKPPLAAPAAPAGPAIMNAGQTPPVAPAPPPSPTGLPGAP